MRMTIGWIGLGTMGFPMAGFLSQQKNYKLQCYNRTLAKSETWVDTYEGQIAKTPYEAAKDADFVFACVGNDKDLHEVTLGENGAFHAMKPGAIFVDHTTASATIARTLYEEALKRNFSFIDAPVSGGQLGAEKGILTIMCGGDETAYAKAAPLMAHYAKMQRLLGASGSGQLAKMVNQICIAGLVQGLSEGIHFAQTAGLNVEDLIDVISKGAAQSWQMENRYKTMNKGEYEFGFAVEWMRKDLNICLEEARNNGAKLPVTALVDQFYADIEEMGGSRYDTSSLLARLTPRNAAGKAS